MSLALKHTVPPLVEPITLAETKAWLRVDNSYTLDDGLILSLIIACRQRAEDYTGRSFMTQQWSYSLDSFPFFTGNNLPGRHGWSSGWFDSQSIYLPRGPLVSVDLITYIAPDGTTNTLDPSLYTVDGQSEPARLLPALNSYWPVVMAVPAVPNAVNILFTAGDTTCPEIFKLAIKLMVASYYENPSDFSSASGAVNSLPLGSQRLLAAHRITPFDYSR